MLSLSFLKYTVPSWYLWSPFGEAFLCATVHILVPAWSLVCHGQPFSTSLMEQIWKMLSAGNLNLAKKKDLYLFCKSSPHSKGSKTKMCVLFSTAFRQTLGTSWKKLPEWEMYLRPLVEAVPGWAPGALVGICLFLGHFRVLRGSES